MNAQPGGEVRASCPFADSRPDGCICIALREPKRVSVDYQARFCLTDRHVQCRRFQRAVPEIPERESAGRVRWSVEPHTFVIAGAVAAIILIAAAAFTFQGTWAGWFNDRSTPTARTGSTINGQPTVIVIGGAATPSAATTPTPEPSAMPVLAVTPSPAIPTAGSTATPTAALTLAASPSPTPTATVTPEPIPTPAITSPTPVVAAAIATPATHVVVSGETLSSIARTYGVAPALIAAANDVSSVDIVATGTTLFIPSPDGHLPDGAPYLGVHIVQVGDALSSIASSFGVTLQNVIAANGISDANHIEVGQVIKIPRGDVIVATPAPASTPVTRSTYTVQPGDTLFSIAKRFGVTIDAIMTANGLTDRNYVYSGEVLVIPGG